MITAEDKVEIQKLIDQAFSDRLNGNKDYYLNQKDKVDLVEKINNLKVELLDKINDLKVELFKYVDSKIERQTRVLLVAMGIGFTVLALIMTVLGFLIKSK